MPATSNDPYGDLLRSGVSIATGAPPDPYGDLLNQAREKAARIRGTVIAVSDTSPDDLAKARRIANYIKVPPAAVQASPVEAAQRAQVQEIQTNVLDAPVLERQFTNADFAALARDDSLVLSQIERGVRAFIDGSPARRRAPRHAVMTGAEFAAAVQREKAENPALDDATARALAMHGTTVDNVSALAGPIRGPAPGFLSVLRGIAGAAGRMPEAFDQGLGYIAADILGLDRTPYSNRLRAMGTQEAAQTPEFETSTGQGLYGGGIGLVRNAPGIVASLLLGSPTPGLAMAGVSTSVPAYEKYRERGASGAMAGLGAVGEGVVEIATELLPMSAMLKAFGKEGPGVGLQMLKSQMHEQWTEQIATVAQDAIDTAIANPDKTWGQYLAERPEAGYQTFLAALVQSGAIAGAHAVVQKVAGTAYQQEGEAARAGQAAAVAENITQLVQASKLRERDAGSFAAFVDQVAESDGVPTEFFIDASVLANSLQQSAVSIDELRAVAPQVAAQLEAAQLVPGADIRVPVAEFAAADPRITSSLVDHLREAPDAMSRAEATAYLATQGQAIRQQVEEEIARQSHVQDLQAGRDAVVAHFERELDAVGKFRPEVNKAYAGLLGSFYVTQAQRVGTAPEALMEKYKLRVASQDVAAAQTLQQAGGVATDTPEFKNWFGESKVVGAKGVPLVVYHQTTKESELAIRGDGFKTGEDFARARLSDEEVPNGIFFKPNDRDIGVGTADKAQLAQMPVYLSLQNPLIVKDRDELRQQISEISPEYKAKLPEMAAVDDEFKPKFDELFGADDTDENIAATDALIVEWGKAGKKVAGELRAIIDKALVENGYDGVILQEDKGSMGRSTRTYIALRSEQVKSVDNRGTFDPNNPSILAQGARAQLSFATDITTAPSVISLLAGADLSSFLHESGHFFLEVQADLASRIETAINSGEGVSDAERGIVVDMNVLLKWFGVEATPEASALDQWALKSLDERREAHERFARGFEKYAMEGVAPSLELQGLFSRFRAWLVSVYKTLRTLNVELTDDVRAVMGRMLASDDAIQSAQDARNMGPLFQSPEHAGMTPEEFAQYQGLATRATEAAASELDVRLLKDMKWLSRARDKAIKAAQSQVEGLRQGVEREVRAEVLSTSVYRAWAFLTGKGDRAAASGSSPAGEEVDNLFTAIAKAGGLNRDELARQWGLDPKEKLQSGVFGSPVVRKTGGLSLDAMGERLVELGYLLPDANGKADLAKFEALFEDQRRGVDRYSIKRQMEGDRPTATLDLPDVASGRLNLKDMKRMFGEESDATWRLLIERRMTSPTGLHPDLVAEAFDFESGSQMVGALVRARPPAQVVAELTDARMLELYGDIASPGALERAADVAVHNQLRAKVIAAELNALTKAGRVRESGDSLLNRTTVDVMARAAENYAAQVIARQRIKDLRPQQYAAAEARSARLALQSLGDTAQAAMHKRNQLVNNYAARAAYAAEADIAKANEFFRKVLRGNKDAVSRQRDFDLVQAARAILAEYGIGTRGEAAQSYLRAVEANDPQMHAVLRDRIDTLTANARPVGELTVEEFRGLEEEIRSLWHQAKRSRQIEIDGQLISIEAAKIPLVQRMEALGIPDRVPGEGQAVTDAERRLAKLQTLRAALRRVESWVGAKDGEAMGPFRRFIWQPVKEAADAYRTDKAKYLKRYRDLLEGLDVGESRIDAPELAYTFGAGRGGSGKAELLHAILHTGNQSNKRKMLLGRQWATDLSGTLDTRRWDQFIQRMIDSGVLTKRDFDFAQGVWDLLEEMKPLAQKAHRDVFGRYFEEVTAEPFTNQFGAFRGGYVPAMMDPEIVKDAATRALQEDENQTLAYAFPSTSKGFTKARVEINRPLLLDLRMLSTHIDKVLLFSHLEQPIRDVRKILASKDVSGPLHRIDPAAFDGLLTPWLNRAARQTVETKVPGDNGLMRFFSKARSRAGMAAMFANVSNTAQQITGFSMAAVKVRPKYLLSAMGDYVLAPRQTAKAVAAASPYMAARMDNEVAQMTDAIDDILLNPSVYEKAQAWTLKHAYFMQAAVDNVMGPIIWTGAYNEALEAGHTEVDSRRLADSAIRETQGSTLPEDVSRMETGNAFVRMFTQFAGYFNMQANTLGTEFAKVQHDLGLRRGMGRGLYVFTIGFLVPAMLSELIVQAFRGGPGDEDRDGTTLDDWLLAVLVMGNMRAVLGMAPGVGQATNAAINAWNNKPYDDRISTSPAVSMIESAAGAPHSVYNAVAGEGSARKAIRDVATLISMTTGLPATAIARPAGYVADLAQGRTSPTSPADAVRGAVTGVSSPESKGR